MANFENVPVQLTGFEMENSSMLWSVFISEVGRNVKVRDASSLLYNMHLKDLVIWLIPHPRWPPDPSKCAKACLLVGKMLSQVMTVALSPDWYYIYASQSWLNAIIYQNLAVCICSLRMFL